MLSTSSQLITHENEKSNMLQLIELRTKEARVLYFVCQKQMRQLTTELYREKGSKKARNKIQRSYLKLSWNIESRDNTTACLNKINQSYQSTLFVYKQLDSILLSFDYSVRSKCC